MSFSSKKALQQNKTKGGGGAVTPSKNSKFLQDFGVCCVCDFGVLYDDFLRMRTIREHDDEYHNNNKAAALLLLSNLFQRANGDSKGLGHGHQSNSSR